MMKRFGVYMMMIGLVFTASYSAVRHINAVVPEHFQKLSPSQDDFMAIETDEITVVVKQSIEREYPEAGIAEAFRDPIGNYKIILALDQKTKIVYLDSNGHWYSPQEKG